MSIIDNNQAQAPIGIGSFRANWIAAGLIPDGPPGQLAPPKTPEEEAAAVRACVRNQRIEVFRSKCPEEFRKKIDRAMIPNVAAWDSADSWKGTFPGIWLWSYKTGEAKTRMLWRQFGRQHVDLGKSVLKITGQALAEEYFGYHMNGEPRSFYRWIGSHDIVMLDDLDKLDLDDRRAPRMCRELFDEFYSWHKPVLVTANEPIAHFEQRIGPSTGRRMSAVCTEVEF